MYVVYDRQDSGHKIFLARSTDSGITWSETEVTSEEDQINPSIAVDSQDNLHIVWQGKVGTSTVYQIRYRKYDGFWQTIENLTNNEERNQETPVIAVDSQNNLHLAWIDGRNIYYRVGVNGNWGDVEIVKDYKYRWERYSSISQFSFAIDNQNVLHFVWFETIPIGWGSSINILHYLKGSSGNWSEAENLTTVDLQNYSSIIIDSQNNVHIVWHELDNRGAEGWFSLVQYLKCSGGCDSSEIETLSEEKIFFVIASPSVAIDSRDYLYVVWKRWNLKPVSQIEYRDDSWQEVKELISPFEWQGFPNLLWSLHPTIAGKKTNQPKTGFAFIFYEGTELKFYGSNDLTWE